MSNSIWEEKRIRRAQLRALAGTVSEEERTAAGARIAETVTALPSWQTAGTVLLFWGMAGEPDTSLLIREALRAGKQVLLPRCLSGGRMEAVPFAPDRPMQRGAYGIPELEGEAFQGNPDLVLVPCVSAAPDGRRLGHGKGYYDRYLPEHPGNRICLCLDRLISDDLPITPEDVRMPCVVTEKRIFYAAE